MKGNQRVIGLDLLRLLAVVMVLAAHLRMIKGMPDWLHPFTRYGSLGVNLFFVLSGFLVSGLLFAEYKKLGGISIRRFYVRRAWKIYPPFYLLLAFTYLYSRYGMGWKMPERMIFAEVFFLQNYFPGHWNHTWSLAVEEHFYIVLPLVLLAFVRANQLAINPFRAIPVLVAAVVVTVFVCRAANFLLWPQFDIHTHTFPTHLRVDALFFGVLLSYWHHFHSLQGLRSYRYALIATGLATFGALLLSGESPTFFTCVTAPTLEYLASAAVLVGVLLCDMPRNRITGSLAALGSYSYSIYLWHMAIIYWVDAPWNVKAPLYLVGALVLGIAMALVWELPTLKVRDRHFPSMLQKAA
jgi:peptidoglycan/LPS O-acetylase OafA/YrhL